MEPDDGRPRWTYGTVVVGVVAAVVVAADCTARSVKLLSGDCFTADALLVADTEVVVVAPMLKPVIGVGVGGKVEGHVDCCWRSDRTANCCCGGRVVKAWMSCCCNW